MLNKINFKFIDGYIVFEDSRIKRKITPINIIKLGEEQFADKSDKALNARYNMKRAVSKIIIRLQAYKFNQQIIRNQQAKQHLAEFTADLEEEDENFSYCGESYYQESDTEGQTIPEEVSESKGTIQKRFEKLEKSDMMVSESFDIDA